MQSLRGAMEMQLLGNGNELTKQTNLDHHRIDVTTIA